MIITLSTVKLVVLAIAAVLGVVFTVNTFPKRQRSENQICVNCPVDHQQLRNSAQDALRAIDSNRTLSSSVNRAARGQHVFNNGVLGFHRSVLQSLLKGVGGYDEQLENLMQDLVIPLSRTEQDAISTMVARFSSDEIYVDYNADVFGEYVKQLRAQLVAYLRADTSVTINERYGIQKIHRQVQFITTQMVNHVVYVDPMARDRWLREHSRAEKQYDQVRRAIEKMFSNILQEQDFKKVSDKIKVFRQRNNWNWDRDRSDLK